MKLGRNALCHCGSGKKFKRCCMNSAPGPFAKVFDDVESTLAMNPQLSPSELDAVIHQRMHDHNNQPHPQLYGLSPEHMANWLNAPFSALQHVTIRTPNTLHASPVMRYLDIMLNEAVEQGGAFKATAKGNLPAKLVKQASELLPEFAVAAFDSCVSISEFAGNNEDKMNALHYTRLLADIAGIMRFRDGRFHVTKATQKQYQALGVQAFFKPLLEAAVSQYNWAYFDYFKYDIELRDFWLFMLWRLQGHHSLDQLVSEMVTTFPDLLDDSFKGHGESPEQNLSFVIESRFIHRFLQFWGFVTINPKRYKDMEPIPSVVNVQPLLKQTFQFDV